MRLLLASLIPPITYGYPFPYYVYGYYGDS